MPVVRRASGPVWLAVACALLLTSGATPTAASGPQTGGSVAEILAAIQLEDTEGHKIRLSSYLGSGPLLLDFWATWCKPCLSALPELDRLHTDLSKRGLRVVAINEDGPRNASKVKPFVRSHAYGFDVVLDLNRDAQRRLNALALPTTMLLDAEGKVLHTSFGYRPGEYEALRKLIEPLLPPADE